MLESWALKTLQIAFRVFRLIGIGMIGLILVLALNAGISWWNAKVCGENWIRSELGRRLWKTFDLVRGDPISSGAFRRSTWAIAGQLIGGQIGTSIMSLLVSADHYPGAWAPV